MQGVTDSSGGREKHGSECHAQGLGGQSGRALGNGVRYQPLLGDGGMVMSRMGYEQDGYEQDGFGLWFHLRLRELDLKCV